MQKLICNNFFGLYRCHGVVQLVCDHVSNFSISCITSEYSKILFWHFTMLFFAAVTHVSAVTVMSTTHAPGDKPHIVEVKEQRVSSLIVAILVGVSVLMAPLLRRGKCFAFSYYYWIVLFFVPMKFISNFFSLVPLAVLLGVFLYMGISSTNNVQLFDRVKLFFMPVKHHGTANYVRRVQTYKMHIFTFIQIICLSTLWIV